VPPGKSRPALRLSVAPATGEQPTEPLPPANPLVETWRDAAGEPCAYAYESAGQFWMDWPGIARFSFDLQGHQITAWPEPGIASRLTEFPGVGPTGASIFLREVQEVWPAVAPYVDAKVTSGAHRVRLPADRESLAGLLAASGQPARLAAALVRVSLSQRAASEVTASVRD
jgi:hypothetical protein